ncbi:hypothetical protein D9615_000014 [Tricholomella constricta]|uniref:DUF6534 domain-containing protein n=1 Tax=Tricholomella constricta TaxID=117010 RepID=A0A8H5HRI4_9AGAR|nr:hypothetical protein D9615_000014 [Tricholomella constricta]
MGEFDRMIGPLLLGIFFNTYLYGIVMFQYAAYQNTRLDDPPWIKFVHYLLHERCFDLDARGIVGLLFLTDTFHCAIAIYLAWSYCVTNYVNPDVLGAGFWVNSITPICTAVSGLVAHLFLGYRFFRLTKNQIAHGVNGALALGVFAVALSAGIVGIKKSVSMNEIVGGTGSPLYHALVEAWLIVQTLLDALIAGCLGYALYTCKPSFMGTQTTFHRLARGAIQTGFIACLLSLADLISFAVGRNTNVFNLFALPMGPVYSNIILDTLLARNVSIASNFSETSSNGKTDIWVPVAVSNSTAPTSSFSLNSIHVKTEVYTDGGRITPAERSSNEFTQKSAIVVL